MLSRDCLAWSAHALARLDAITRWSGSASSCLPACFLTVGSVSSFSPHLFAFVSPLVSSRPCWAGCCHEMVWLGQLFVSPLVSFCLPTCFLVRLLGWMLSQDGLARSALCLPACFHLSARLSALCLPACFLLSPYLFSHALAQRACLGRVPGQRSAPELRSWAARLADAPLPQLGRAATGWRGVATVWTWKDLACRLQCTAYQVCCRRKSAARLAGTTPRAGDARHSQKRAAHYALSAQIRHAAWAAS